MDEQMAILNPKTEKSSKVENNTQNLQLDLD
nr:MAG TPA: hypothetical protein [Caudoviricetes sp.]